MIRQQIKPFKEKPTNRLYRQCQLRKSIEGFNRFQTAYVPSKFAVKGEVVKIKTNGEWVDGWVIEKVWKEVDESFLDGMRNAVKHHADVSDI